MKLREIGRAIGCEVTGNGEVEIVGVAAIEHAAPGTLTFLADRRLIGHLRATGASAVILPPDIAAGALPCLCAEDPYRAFVAATELLHPPPPRPCAAVHATAVVAPGAVVGAGAAIGPHVVIGDGVTIGANATLHANVTIYPGAQIGEDFTAHAGVVVRESVRIGDRVILHAGAVIGSDGFGYLPLPEGNRKIPQIGTVVLEDDVEIGANSTVDRAALGTTFVGRGTKIDNLVMVAHGCRIGPGCLLAAQVGLAGGTTLGARVMMGGQAGAAGHLSVGDGAQIGAQAGLAGDVPPGAVWMGYPATDVRRWRRASLLVRQLPEMVRRLRALEQALELRGAGREKK
jgi:UDP-3-O-[3-hydroxymyristoyl] glucosamine N-acyltransferase